MASIFLYFEAKLAIFSKKPTYLNKIIDKIIYQIYNHTLVKRLLEHRNVENLSNYK